MTNKSLYDLLEISPNATQEEIKESYRLIVSMLHPDKFPQGSKQWVRASEKIQEVNEAYQILKDVEKRSQYNRERFHQGAILSEESPDFTSHISHSASTPRDSQPAPLPSAPQPEAYIQQDNSGVGCSRIVSGLLGIGCFVPVIESVVSGSSSGFPTWANLLIGTVFIVTGVTFLVFAFPRRKKS